MYENVGSSARVFSVELSDDHYLFHRADQSGSGFQGRLYSERGIKSRLINERLKGVFGLEYGERINNNISKKYYLQSMLGVAEDKAKARELAARHQVEELFKQQDLEELLATHRS